MEPVYSTKCGELLAIMIVGSVGRYIAEVVQEEPLRLKVEESGVFANLKDGDYVINGRDSATIQDPDESKSTALLAEALRNGHPFASGLRKLGITDGKMHAILPVTD